MISSCTYSDETDKRMNYETKNLVKVVIKLIRNIKTMEFYLDEKLEFTII